MSILGSLFDSGFILSWVMAGVLFLNAFAPNLIGSETVKVAKKQIFYKF